MYLLFVVILADDMAENPKHKEEKSSLGDAEGKIFAFVFLFAQILYHWRLCFKRLHLDFSCAYQNSLNLNYSIISKFSYFSFLWLWNSVLKGGSPTEENFDGKCFPIPLRLSMKMF